MQTFAAIVQSVAALIFVCTVVLQYRATLIDRLLRRWERTADGPTPDELAGTPYSPRQIDFVNARIKESRVWWWWPWRGN